MKLIERNLKYKSLNGMVLLEFKVNYLSLQSVLSFGSLHIFTKSQQSAYKILKSWVVSFKIYVQGVWNIRQQKLHGDFRKKSFRKISLT